MIIWLIWISPSVLPPGCYITYPLSRADNNGGGSSKITVKYKSKKVADIIYFFPQNYHLFCHSKTKALFICMILRIYTKLPLLTCQHRWSQKLPPLLLASYKVHRAHGEHWTLCWSSWEMFIFKGVAVTQCISFMSLAKG
jgi:hypothetical protein